MQLCYKRRHLYVKKSDDLGLDNLAAALAGDSPEVPAEGDAKNTQESDASSHLDGSSSALQDAKCDQDVTCILIRDECQSTDLDEKADEINSNMQCSSSPDDDSFDQSSLNASCFSVISGDPGPCPSPRPMFRQLPVLPPAVSPKSSRKKTGKIAQAGAGRRRRSKKSRQQAAAGTSKDMPLILLS